MKSNLEKAKEIFNGAFKFSSGKVAMSESEFMEAIELASKPDWKYPINGEFPEDRKFIFLYRHSHHVDDSCGYIHTYIEGSNQKSHRARFASNCEKWIYLNEIIGD